MKKICIVGMGYVGKAVKELLKNHYIITEREVDDNYDSMNMTDLSVICVPTLSTSDGKCDTSIVEKVIIESNAPLYLIKSTVPPGTVDKLKLKTNKRIVFSPEYIGEGGYAVPFWKEIPDPTDMKHHNFQIFGGDIKDTSEIINIFSKVMGPYCKYHQTDAKTAELVKYMVNSFIATKIVFCHEFFRIAENFGIDYNELRELWLLDQRVSRGFTSVFDKLGYDGKCIPKDISALYEASKNSGFTSDFLRQVMKTNEQLKNWEK